MKFLATFRTPVGVALAPDRALITDRGGAVHERSLHPWDGGSFWPDLEAALREARGQGVRGPLAFALLPPLVRSRGIELPRLAREDRRAVLQRDGTKHFPLEEGIVVDGTPLTPGGSPESLLVVAASEKLLDAILAASSAAGFEVAAIGPATWQWARRMDSAGGTVTVPAGEWQESITVAEGRLVAIRRRPIGEAPLGASLPDDPARMAARDVGAGGGPVLFPPREWERRRAAERGIRRRAWAVAAALLFLAIGADLIGLHRDLARVEARRAEIRPQVEALLAARGAAQDVEGRLALLDSLDASRPRWVSAFARLSASLPHQAYLTGVRGAPDSLVLEGVAPEASQVFDALRGFPGIVAVRAEAPYRQETGVNGAPVERFAFGTRWAPGRVGGE